MKNITTLSKENKDSIDKIFTKNKKFDVINSQFVFHYLFGTKSSIDNLVINIKTFLKKDGYILISLFDPVKVEALFDDSGKISSYYTDEDGKRLLLYEIVKKYTNDASSDVGKPIDVHMSWINADDKYIEEYLVSRKLLLDTMSRAGCRLVDTDVFSNLYNMNKPYFENVIKYEENPKNKKYYEKIAQFYGNLKGIDKESRNYSFLFRYYVFQKME